MIVLTHHNDRSNRKRPALAAALMGAGLLFAPIAHAQATDATTKTADRDPRAVALLAKAETTLAATQTLSADFVTTTVYPGAYHDLKEEGSVTLARPGDARITIARYRRVRAGDPWQGSGNGSLVVADGASLWTVVRHPESSQVRRDAEQPKALNAALRNLEPLASFFQGAKDTSSDPTTARYVGAQTDPTGTPVEVVEIPGRVPGETRQLSLDADGFIRHEIVTRPADNGTGAIVRDIQLTNLHHDPSTASADTFSFTPPADAIPIERAAGEKPLPLLAAGEAAPDFTAEDADGKPIHLSDFHGKTVLLKFWATWCWPCRQSLPETEQIAHRRAKEGVVVLAVALWDSRAAFRNWVQKNAALYPDVHFAFDGRPQGIDAGSALYHVAATPTHYVIDPSGRVSAVFAGYNGPSPALAEALEQASHRNPVTTSANK